MTTKLSVSAIDEVLEHARNMVCGEFMLDELDAVGCSEELSRKPESLRKLVAEVEERLALTLADFRRDFISANQPQNEDDGAVEGDEDDWVR